MDWIIWSCKIKYEEKFNIFLKGIKFSVVDDWEENLFWAEHSNVEN